MSEQAQPAATGRLADTDPPAAVPTPAWTAIVARTPAAASAEVHSPPPLTVATVERDLRARLLGPNPAPSRWAWWGPILVAALAAVLRLLYLDRPHELVFDETYYVKDAYSLLARGYEARWAAGADERFVLGDTSALLEEASYVVHPPLGKWLIGAGINLLGVESAVGWRLAGAVLGALTVLMVARIGRRLFASTLLGCVAGLALALDGLHLVLSRTGILDVFVAVFVVAAFGAVLLDREQSRSRLAARAAPAVAGHAGGRPPDPWGPRLGIRWWLVAAGGLAGLGMGVKWSLVYALAALGILVVAWDFTARRAVGARLWVGAALLRDAPANFLAIVPAAALAYLATWLTWFTHSGSYLRQWAVQNPEQAPAAVPAALASLVHFHHEVWKFHTTLEAAHGYASEPLGWLIQWRPTSFFWADGAGGVPCGAERCVQAITALGNPVVWWAGAVGLVVVTWAAVRLRDWRAWFVLAGYGGTWLPWLMFYPNRTIFTFYAVAMAPFVALSFAFLLAYLAGRAPATAAGPRPPGRAGPGLALAVLVLTVVAAWYFWPVWTAQPIGYHGWYARMWLATWV